MNDEQQQKLGGISSNTNTETMINLGIRQLALSYFEPESPVR